MRRIPPRWILYGHPQDQPTYLGAHTGVLVRVRPLPHNELPMPSQDRVGCHDARDLIQELPSQAMPTDRQPSSVVIGESEPLTTEMASKNPIFFDQIRDRVVLLAI